MNELEQAIKELAEYTKRQFLDLRANTLTRQEFEREMEILRRSAGKAGSVSPIVLSGLENRITHLETRQAAESHSSSSVAVANLENKVAKLEAEMERMAGSKDHTYLTNVENKVARLEAGMKKMSSRAAFKGRDAADIHIQRLEEMENKFDQLSKSVEKSSPGLVLGKVRDDIVQRMKNETDALRAELNARLDTAETKLAQSHSGIMQSHAERKENMAILQKQIEDLQKRTDEMSSDFKEMLEMDDIDDYKQLVSDIRDMRINVEEEVMLRMSLERKVKELNEEIKKASHGRIDVEKPQQVDISEEIRNKIDEETTKIVTKHLGEFAKALDKKLPEIATKDDVERLAVKARMTESVEKRLELLEQKMTELLSVVRGYNRSSRHFIVE